MKRELSPFGVEVKMRLVEKGMTQVELAQEVGTTPKYLNLILYGERSGEKYIPEIISVLGLNPQKVAKMTGIDPERVERLTA